MTVCGQVEGAEFSTNIAGRFMSIKRRVYVSEQATANLLSLSQIQKECLVEFIGKIFKVTLVDGVQLIFRNVNNLYICNVPKDIIQPNTYSYLNTQTSSLKSHDAAELLIRKLGYPSDRSVVKALQNGSIHNAPCSSSDLYEMRRARGPSVPVLKGKVYKQKN